MSFSNMEDRSNHLVWLDLETTGLDPDRHRIIEVGWIVTDHSLREIASWNLVAQVPEIGWGRMDSEAREMHHKNGLLDESVASSLTLPEVEERAVGRLRQVALPGESPLCGSSPHFDREFLRVWCPLLHGFFHYQNLDISSVSKMVDLFRPMTETTRPQSRHLHRSIPDLRDTLTLARYYRDYIFLDQREQERREINPEGPDTPDRSPEEEYANRVWFSPNSGF